MILSDLKKVVAAYHRKNVSDLTVDGLDLFLVAANNARRNAELKHNFEYCRIAATLDITGASGGSLANAVIMEGTATARVKEIVNVSRLNASGDRRIPLNFTRSDIAVEVERSEEETGYYPGWYNRTPSDADLLNRRGRALVVQRGHQIFVHPQPLVSTDTLTLYLEGYGELPDYTTENLGTMSVAVTGTSTPSATGTYTFMGIGTDEAYFYTRIGNPPIRLTWDTDTWYLQVVGSDTSANWTFTSADKTNPNGTYTATGGSGATGSPIITQSGFIAPDFLLTYGAAYLQWECIIELNYLFTTFVPRQEGNLSSPEKQRDIAWNNLLSWDSFLIDSNLTRPR